MSEAPRNGPACPGTPRETSVYRPLRDPAVWLILLVYLLLAVVYSYVMLLGQGPDESNRHFPYVRWLAHTWALPVEDPEITGGNLELHPPLYYLLLTPVYLLTEHLGEASAMRALRWTSPFMVLGGLLLWVPVLWQACGRNRRSFLFVLALTAWWPNLFVDAGAITNDAGAILASAALLYMASVHWWRNRSLQTALMLGALAGLGALMKASTIATSVGVLGVWLAWQHGRRFFRDPDFWVRGLAIVGGFLVVCGWWYVRNYELYGAFTPFPRGYRGIPEDISNWQAVQYGLVWPLLWRALHGLWASVFAGVVWFPPQSHVIVYNLLRLLCVLAIVGLALVVRRRWGKWPWLGSEQAPALLLSCAGFGVLWLSAIWMSVFVHMGVYQGGRYLLLYLPGLVLPLGLGLHELYRRTRAALPYVFTAVCMPLLSVLVWYHLWTYWNPKVQEMIERSTQ